MGINDTLWLFSVTRGGKPLDESLYTWDERRLEFTTEESDLIMDFSGITGATIVTGSRCIIKVSYNCKLRTGDLCIFSVACGGCQFECGKHCSLVRLDTREVIVIPPEGIRLNGLAIPGYY